MSKVLRALCPLLLCWLGWASPAWAARLALVDGADSPLLQRAIAETLAPWAIEVVDWPSGRPAQDTGPLLMLAEDIARNANARYVVWREDGQLHVLDAELARRETRPIEEWPSDEASSTALALTIKTLLRLPRPGTRRATWQLVPLVQLGYRVAFDGDGGSGARAAAGLEVGLPQLRGVRLGVRAELGPEVDVTGPSYKGTWLEWSVQASASRDFSLKEWTLGVWLAGGLTRSTLAGEEMRTARTERHTGALASMNAALGRWLGPVEVGVATGLSVRSAGQYQRQQGGGGALWQEPAVIGSLLAMVALRL